MAPNEAEHTRWNDSGWTVAWQKREVLTQSVTPFLLEMLALRPGERVLDIGCGGGRTTIAAAEAVAPSGRAVGADISRPLLALARERASATQNADFVEADLQVDLVDGGGFDAVMSQFGVMFFDEPLVAFANIARHIGPGGRLVFACWQEMARNRWFLGPAIAPYVVPPPPPAPGKSPTGPFALGDASRTTAILEAAGFAEITRRPQDLDVDVPETAVTDDAQLRFMGVPDDAIGEARAAVAALMSSFEDRDGKRRFPLAFQVFSARVSG